MPHFVLRAALLGAACAVNVPVSVLLPESGPLKSQGDEYKQTAQASALYINAQPFMTDPDVQLQLSFHDTNSTAYGAWKAAHDATATTNSAPALLVGPSYSGPALTASVTAQHSSTPMVLFDATSPALSDKAFVLRTCTTDSAYARATLQLMQHYDWQQFGMVYSSSQYGRGFKELLSLEVHAAGSGVAIAASAEFAQSDSGAVPAKTRAQEIEFALDAMQKANVRILVLLAHPLDAADLLLAADARGMTGKGWAWIGPEWATGEMWQQKAGDASTMQRLQALMAGVVGIVPDNRNQALRRVLPALPATVQVANAGMLFDALWLAASTLAKAPNPDTLRGAPLFGALAGGTARLSPVSARAVEIGADSRARTNQPLELVNLRGSEFVTVGTFAADGSLVVSTTVTWPGGQSAAPSDRGSTAVHTHAVYFFVVLVGLVLAFVVDSVLHEYQINTLSSSGATILLGVVVGGLVYATGDDDMVAAAKFDEKIFTLLLLPIIVFESGFVMRRTHFFSQLGSIITFAVAGTMISTFVVGALLNGVALGTLGSALPLEQALAFAALISAVDPVATLSTFVSLKVEPKLNALVYGESIVNDAVAIVLYRAFVGFFEREVTASAVFEMLGVFVGISIGSVVFGLLVTVLCALTFKYAPLGNYELLEALVLLCFSYMAFALSEAAHCSGIVASVTAGIAMNHFAKTNVSREGRRSVEALLLYLANLAESLIFFQVGMNTILYSKNISWAFIFVTILFCVIGRALNIFPLAFLINRCGRTPSGRAPIPFAHQIVMWHAGLRGAIAYALAITFPSHHQDVIISTTSFVVLFTVFCLGGSTVPLLNVLKVRRGVTETHQDRERAVVEAKQASAWKRWWITFANERVLPWIRKDNGAPSEHDALVLDEGGEGAGNAAAELTAPSAWSMADEDGRDSMDDHAIGVQR
eukprot:g5153.t1